FLSIASLFDIDNIISIFQKLLLIFPRPHPLRSQCLSTLAKLRLRRYEFSDKSEDLDKSISHSTEAILLPFHTKHSSYVIEALFSLAKALLRLREVEQLGDMKHAITYLHGTIECLREARIRFPDLDAVRFALSDSLSDRFMWARTHDDYEEAMSILDGLIADRNENNRCPSRFPTSYLWTHAARSFRHPSTLTAYQTAISLMQQSVSFAPTLAIQHFRLVAMRDEHEKLPLDYASYLVQTGQLKQAIETLERGRGLLWSEMRGLRASIDQLRAVNLPLAEKFAAVNQDLEAVTIAGFQSVWMEDGTAGDHGMDPVGHLVMQQRKLVEERDRLISQIRTQPGFDTFLIPSSFDTLCSAAAGGPVILINHSRWRSDIIILLHDSPPSLIPTMIERLRELNILEQSRVWWCPTSIFSSLPLHAMGPIRSDGHTKLYFSDVYIPSYTPTLSALVESRKPSTQALDTPSMLLVVQPDAQMPSSLQEMRIVRNVCPLVETLFREKATPSSTLERLKHHRFAHISSHGILETGKPFDAFFKLYEGTRLTLLDIVRSRLPTAEFAFLSACRTAEITEESIANEGLHLAAAVQYTGFRSVVGTMWEMADIDGPVVAGSFYKSVFSDKWKGIPYYERTAEALRDAVRDLRRKKSMTLERWVNYVHYGA
ncbi:CHAT domain-containing protein, partial [Russula compacta]